MQTATSPPPSSFSQDMRAEPSPLLAVICLAIVHRLRPQWVSVTIREAASAERLSAERVSRLCSRALLVFESTLAALTRMGRPPQCPTHDQAGSTARELALLRSLLGVATAILQQLSLRSHSVRALLLGAWLRLSVEYPSLTQKEFCHTLGLSPRTLRSWLTAAPVTTNAAPPSPPPPPPKRRPRRRRFSFDLILPDTQITADTTQIETLGVPLKMIAAQDVGGRDQNLFDSVIVDDHESAELVCTVLLQAINDRKGIQVPVDQGTPYMAQATRTALDQVDCEHDPQREGTPTDKSTIERAFRSVKTYADPLLSLSNHIASLVPELRRPDLAKGLTTLVLIALLRAYQGGARAAQRAITERGAIDPETLARAAQHAREEVRVQHQSKRLRLQFIHENYQIGGSAQSFVRFFSPFPLPVIEQAERAFAGHAHRSDIINRNAYFTAILFRLNEQYQNRQTELRQLRERNEKWLREIEAVRAERQFYLDHPLEGLRAALDILPEYWDSRRQKLLFDGIGPGRSGARTSIARLTELHGAQTATDIALGTLRDFASRNAERLEPAAITAIDTLVRQFLPTSPTPQPTTACMRTFASAMLSSIGKTQHPPPP